MQGDDLRKQRAKIARERHERLCQRVKAHDGKPGVTRLRARVYDAAHEALRAELEARK